jgi:hypothetical protein
VIRDSLSFWRTCGAVIVAVTAKLCLLQTVHGKAALETARRHVELF